MDVRVLGERPEQSVHNSGVRLEIKVKHALEGGPERHRVKRPCQDAKRDQEPDGGPARYPVGFGAGPIHAAPPAGATRRARQAPMPATTAARIAASGPENRGVSLQFAPEGTIESIHAARTETRVA